MKWIEFAVYTTDDGLEAVSGALNVAGVEQVALEESSKRVSEFLRESAPYWDFADAVALAAQNGPCVKAYIADLPENGGLLARAREAVERLRPFSSEFGLGEISIRETRMDDEDWANNWKQYYKPMPVGDRLLVCPSWERESLSAEQTQGREIIYIDPGMVFGTGGHHTTRMCLELIEEHVRSGYKMLDLGCGSGILAIAALRLGADFAMCADIDPVAERVVNDNMLVNGIEPARYVIRIGDILADETIRKELGGEYDFVAANIVAGVIVALCPYTAGFIKPGGLFMCSGIIDEREEEVRCALTGAGFEILEVLRSADEAPNGTISGWVALLSRKL